jgi:hypothetical protein
MEVIKENKNKEKGKGDKDKEAPLTVVLSLEKNELYENHVKDHRPILDSPVSNEGCQYSQTPRFGVPEEDDSTEVSSDSSGNIIANTARRGSATKSNDQITFKKYSYREVEREIDENYFDENEYYSCALDILATYLRGQKLIYMESKSYCEKRLNLLMMPAILLSTTATVLASIIKEYTWGAYLLAGLNGVIAFLLAVVNYLKLDATSEAHKISAHQYDKLQSSVEFTSGKILLFTYDPSNPVIDAVINEMSKKLTDIESKIADIKGTNQFIIPKPVRTRYPVIYNTNVFLIIKKIEDIRKRKINSLKEVKNQKNYLTAVLRSKKNKDKKTTNLELEIVRLQKEKDRHINSLLMLKSAFSIIDDMFIKEMENAEKYKKMTFRRWFLCGCGMREEDNDPRKLSTFVEDVMDPYGRQDRLQKTEEAACKKMDDTFFKKLLNEFQANSKLLRDNINVTKNIYDTLEQGQLTTKAKDKAKDKDKPITLKKQGHIVKLFGSPREENLSVEIDELACDNDEIKSIRSDSSNSLMDIDVVCVQTQYSL